MKTALVVGGSGLVGSALIKILLDEPTYDCVYVLGRKELPLIHSKVIQKVVDFDVLEEEDFDFQVNDAFCTLGTTIAKAGSKEAFTRVDHGYVCSFARKALSCGASGFFVVSSMGANPSSTIFYNKVKGQMEEDLKKMDFPCLGIFRPSLLLGPRQEKRTGERFAAWMMKTLNFMIPSKYKAIHVDRVAEKMVRLAGKEVRGVYILESDQLQQETF